MGAHPKAIQERLGHSSITVTLDTYGHLMPGMGDALAGALDALITKSIGHELGTTKKSNNEEMSYTAFDMGKLGGR